MVSPETPINIVIPMAGQGSRFQAQGYSMPKPLINILSHPMLIWLLSNLKFHPLDTLYLALPHQTELQYNISEIVRHKFPSLKIRTILLQSPTRGPADTLYHVVKAIPSHQASLPLLSLDCDTIYFSNILQSFRSLSPPHAACFYFHQLDSAPIFSYLLTCPPSNRIHAIAEKRKFSTLANTGAYGFPNAIILYQYLQQLLATPLPPCGEYYISAVISTMLENEDLPFRAIFVPNFACVGTPPQLERFIADVKRNPSILERREIIFDFDSAVSLCPNSAPHITADKVLTALRKETWDVIRGFENLGFDVVFAGTNDLCHGIACAKYVLLHLPMRRTNSSVTREMFPLDGTLSKTIGW